MEVCPHQFKSFNIQRHVKQNISILRLHQLSEVLKAFITNTANLKIKFTQVTEVKELALYLHPCSLVLSRNKRIKINKTSKHWYFQSMQSPARYNCGMEKIPPKILHKGRFQRGKKTQQLDSKQDNLIRGLGGGFFFIKLRNQTFLIKIQQNKLQGKIFHKGANRLQVTCCATSTCICK